MLSIKWWGADYFYSFNPFISYTLFLLLCLINSFFDIFEKTQLQIKHFLEHHGSKRKDYD